MTLPPYPPGTVITRDAVDHSLRIQLTYKQCSAHFVIPAMFSTRDLVDFVADKYKDLVRQQQTIDRVTARLSQPPGTP